MFAKAWLRRLLLLTGLSLALLVPFSCQWRRPVNPLPLPQVMLWAWERNEDLRFLDAWPAAARPGIAYLQATIYLRGSRVILRKRVGALELPQTAVELPVVRIESDATSPPTLEPSQQQALASAILAVLQPLGHRQLQLDFEAVASQRMFYRGLLAKLRSRLGARFPISMTALTSWCLEDRWLRRLPVDEIVPMFYRLGPDGGRLRLALERGTDLAPECQAAHGFTTDEPFVHLPHPRRIYLFSPVPWHPALLARALERLGRAATDPTSKRPP